VSLHSTFLITLGKAKVERKIVRSKKTTKHKIPMISLYMQNGLAFLREEYLFCLGNEVFFKPSYLFIFWQCRFKEYFFRKLDNTCVE
jgi:hypothetical protein